MAKKPFGHCNKTHFDNDNNNGVPFERFSFSSRFDERRRSNIGNISMDNGMSRASSVESLLDDASMRATNVFYSLDPDERGFIKQEDLFGLNLDLKEDELKDVFKQLDHDSDGCINLEDFKAGLKLINKTVHKKNLERRQSRVFSLSSSPPNGNDLDQKPNLTTYGGKRVSFGNSLDEGMTIFSCKEKMTEFYGSINHIQPELSEQFNDLVEEMAKDVKDLIMDKHYMIAGFQREKAAYENAIRQLEEEYESQINYISKNETKQEVERIEKEFRQVMLKKQEEIKHLREILIAEEELSKNVATSTSQTNMEFKEELSKLQKENMNLQIQLSASQSEYAVIRSEQVTLKQQFQEKISQLQDEKKNLHSFEGDFQNLQQQVRMLRDINRRLQDTNDNLRSVIETSPSLNEVLRNTCNNSAPAKCFQHNSDNLLICDPAYSDPRKQGRYDGSEGAQDEHGDSGLSTLRDVAELVSEIQSIDVLMKGRRDQFDGSANAGDDCQTHSPNSMEHTMVSKPNSLQVDVKKDDLSPDEYYGSVRKQQGRERKRHKYSKEQHMQPRGNASDSEYPEDNYDIKSKNCVPQGAAKNIQTVMPERVFKVVFAGDASVGKSTFIMRLCTNSFVPDCQMTIGIDFRNTTIEVEGKVVGLQLWDTAGQERFRSLTVNYFRKADGVLLLYDSTYQESFIHVRDWVEAIRTAAGDDIPIVLVANKCDLVERFEQEGRRVVSRELGIQLAKDNKLIFVESSAKSGHNIHAAIEELTKLLALNEDLWGARMEVTLQNKSGTELTKKASQCCK